MTKELTAYVEFWTKQKRKLEGEIAIKRRSLEQAMEKLSDPEFHLQKELERGSVKVSKALGLPVTKKPKTVLKKSPAATEKIEIPTVETDLARAADTVPEKKAGWGLF